MDVPEGQIESSLAQSSESLDAPRRTWLAAERTWLAWWRTALGGAAVAIAIGRFLPSVTGGSRWPYAFLGIGYGVIAVAVLMTGLVRQRRISAALRRGGYSELPESLVVAFTVSALVLVVATLVIVAADV